MSTSHNETEYLQLAEAFRKDLAPEGQIENLLVDEIVNAAWRLRHCADDDDHSRNFAHRILHNSIADLRRIQTERTIREELDPEMPAEGLVDYRALIAAASAQTRFDLETRKLNGTDTVIKIIDKSLPTVPKPEENKSQTENWLRSAGIPRGAQCPCGSGEKYKRCCGRNAPPVLSKAA